MAEAASGLQGAQQSCMETDGNSGHLFEFILSIYLLSLCGLLVCDQGVSVKDVICERCGVWFQTPGKYAKYCPVCKQVAYQAKLAEHNQRKNERKREATRKKRLLMQDDYIQICLNCVKPTCSGNCKLLPDYIGS